MRAQRGDVLHLSKEVSAAAGLPAPPDWRSVLAYAADRVRCRSGPELKSLFTFEEHYLRSLLLVSDDGRISNP
jgi:hypothetical protein